MPLNYEINANLRLQGGGGGFQRSMNRMSDRVRSFADRLRGTRSVVGGLMRSLIGLGAGYIGFHAITGGIRRAIGGMLEFNRTMESTRIGMQTILAAVDGIDFSRAGEMADQVFRQLEDDAVRSIATAQDLAQIYQGILGPIRSAGAELSTVRDITLQVATASAATGIDFAQAQRDIGLMVRGTAGMDTRLFSILRSMGRITQTTEEWNRELTAIERVTAIQEALEAFEPGGAAFGQSMEGLAATFKGLIQIFGRSFSGPIFERIKSSLSTINNLMIANRDAISTYLERVGERAARSFQRVVDAAFEAGRWIIEHWDQISARMQAFGNQIREHGPQLAKMAAAMTALSAVGRVLAPILTMVSSVMALFEGGGVLAGLFGGGAAAAGVAGVGGAAAGATVAGATTAAATTVAATSIEGAGLAFAEMAAGLELGGGAAAGGGGLAAAATTLGPLAIVLAAVAGAAIIVTQYWDDFVLTFEAFLPVLQAMWTDVQAIGAAFWEILRPALKMLGTTLLLSIVPAFIALLMAIRVVLIVLRALLEALAWVANAIEEYLIDPIIGALVAIGAAIADFIAMVLGNAAAAEAAAAGRPQLAIATDPRVDRMLDAMEGEPGPTGRTGLGLGGVEQIEAPTARPQTVNNFHRGSVTVRQEFRQADPDRIMVRMINDIDAQAERRIQSGFAPALTR